MCERCKGTRIINKIGSYFLEKTGCPDCGLDQSILAEQKATFARIQADIDRKRLLMKKGA